MNCCEFELSEPFNRLNLRSELIEATANLEVYRDIINNFLLSLSVANSADFFITEDEDLQSLK